MIEFYTGINKNTGLISVEQILETSLSYGQGNVWCEGYNNKMEFRQDQENYFIKPTKGTETFDKVVILNNYSGIKVEKFTPPKGNYLLVVSPDDTELKREFDGQIVKIDTPVNRPLWSAVAVGIYLETMKRNKYL